ncbi:MAG: OsmC family protein [Acidobacteria bacterium]|nr:OsmC family protein [Acidobacteriota bacterium]
MPIRTAEAEWNGSIRDGRGTLKVGSKAFETPYDFPSRFESGTATNPEELIGAAHAGCFSMALSAALGRQNFQPQRIQTRAEVALEKAGEGFRISWVHLHTEGVVPGISPEQFARVADDAKANCPVSKALAGVEIRLTANLVNERR